MGIEQIPRVFMANVGVNASHIGMGLQSPRFEDGRFEFITIPEVAEVQKPGGTELIRYCDLRCWNEPEMPLSRYIPASRHKRATHADPEFYSMSYGDECGRTARSAALKQMRVGDYLVFLARLANYREGKFTGEAGFYLIGYFKIGEIIKDIRSEPGLELAQRLGHNAHFRRAAHDSHWYDGFYVFVGSARSQRYTIARPFGKIESERYLRDKKGENWHWGSGRSDLQIIGSYTRTCRCILDSTRGEAEAERSESFIKNMLL